MTFSTVVWPSGMHSNYIPQVYTSTGLYSLTIVISSLESCHKKGPWQDYRTTGFKTSGFSKL